MLQRIADACERWPDRPAFLIGGRHHTYREFASALSSVRAILELEPAGASCRVGVIALDDIRTYAAIFGILFSGRTYVPINPASLAVRNKSIIQQADLGIILSSSRSVDIPAVDGVSVIYIDELPETAINLSAPNISLDDPAYILFTSGSTGVPKGVPITHRNLTSFVDSFFDCTCDLTESDRVLQMFELTFDFSVICYFGTLSKGACVCTVPRDVVRYTFVLELMMDQGITVAPMVPSILSYLRPYFDEIRLPSIRHSYFCGEALLEEVVSEWRNCVPNALVQNFYGPTEVTVFSLVYDCSVATQSMKALDGVVCIGRPMRGVGAILVDEQLKPVASGERGELCLSGPQVTPGYWRDPNKNEDAFFVDDSTGVPIRYYRTGDLAMCDEEADFFFCGRVDFQVQVQGYRVELGEIEFHARAAAPKSNLCAVAFKNSIGNTQIHLFVESLRAPDENMRTYLGVHLPAYMIPSKITTIPQMPLNSSGKIDRPALAERAKKELER